MNTLEQQTNGLIGSLEAISSLEQKRSAQLLVISDVHGDYPILRTIIQKAGAAADALVFCGDGAGDLEKLLDEAQTNETLLAAIPPVIAFARGNGDPTYVKHLKVPDLIHFTAAGRTVLAVHGHRYDVDYGTDTLAATAGMIDADLVFYGHTHRPDHEENDGTFILNPGSCSRPRGGNPPSFATVTFPGTTERYQAEFYSIEKNIFGSLSFSIFSF